jgi:hypothetical protein
MDIQVISNPVPADRCAIGVPVGCGMGVGVIVGTISVGVLLGSIVGTVCGVLVAAEGSGVGPVPIPGMLQEARSAAKARPVAMTAIRFREIMSSPPSESMK